MDLIGLYIHIPFCIQKCLYCDFVSYTSDETVYEKYLNALEHEMSRYTNLSADTVFIGGGTPTVLSPALLDRLFEMVHKNFNLHHSCEFTIEANPKTLTDDKLSVMKNGGVNRLSIGVQSFFDDELKAIGRIHTAEDAVNTIKKAQKHGFDNINIDIMSSLPYQTADKLAKSLETAVLLGAEHISCYSLIVEEGTPIEKLYQKGIYKYTDENTDREMYYKSKEILSRYGFSRYEISNYAKENRECRHNIKYWSGQPYIGLGVAAHSYDGAVRVCNTNNLQEYINGNYEAERIVLTDDDKKEEFMITGLRMSVGISEQDFFERFNEDINSVYGNVLQKFIGSGHIEYNNGRYRLTDKGIDVSNSVLCEFLL